MILKPSRISASHRDAFLKRYQGLHAWAIQMTGGDRAQAEDLLHDLFILFTLSQPDLNRITNLDNYLYTSLRNLHISQLRRTTRRRFEQLSVVEYESARLSLHSIANGRELIQAQEELRRVCHYACARKETANAASVLLLRFFHGYYPSEIARVVLSTRYAVDKRLQAARVEARAYLENAESLAFLQGQNAPAIPEVLPGRFATALNDFLRELQQLIFSSRQGGCLSRDELKALYAPDREGPIPRKHLSHIVSCRVCLDSVNNLLGLPSLSERYPTDTMDKDNKKGGGPTDSGGKGGAVQKLAEWESEAREIFEHKPEELCVSVNGYLLGSQLVGAELSELTLNVAVDERISFCEVFSEQGLRLLMMNVEDLPPTGPGEIRQRVELSEARSLESSLLFSNPFPTLHVTYHDPALAQESVVLGEETEQESGVTAGAHEAQPEARDSSIKQFGGRFPSVTQILRARFFNPRVWLRPSTVTVLFAVFLLAVVLFVALRRIPTPPTPSAAELLQNSSLAEDALASDRQQVIHRTVTLEERRVSESGAVASGSPSIYSRKIEIWQSADKGLVARRLYDDKGALIAGDWRRSDGVQTVYHHGAKPQIQNPNPVSAIRNFDNVWQLSPSAKDFTSLIGQSAVTSVEQRRDIYVVSAESAKSADGSAPPTVKKAVLILNRSDLHPIEQTLVITQGNETREYRFIEVAFEQKPLNTVAPSVFDPDKELLSAISPNALVPTPNTPTPATGPGTRVPVVATAVLEVEVLQLLNQAGADMGEQINVTRTPEGRLSVQGITETEKRKRELLSALNPVANNAAVTIEIQTLDEALARRPKSQASANSISIESSQANSSALPIDKELRQYLAARNVSDSQTDEAIRQFSNRTIHRSLQILKHASALKSLTQRFSPEQLQNLDQETKTKWLLLVRQHAQAVQQETMTLEREVSPIFPGMLSGDVRHSEINNDELAQAIEQLFASCSENDRAISAAFTISLDASRGSAIKSPQFWRSLKSTESLAAGIAEFRF